jgi:putative DNA primase/helicase
VPPNGAFQPKPSDTSKPAARKARGNAPAGDDASEPLRPDLWPEPVDGKALVEDFCNLIGDYVVMTRQQKMAVTLWALHAHAHDAAQHSPILLITAPLPECGKTQLLDVLQQLVPRPWRADNATAAAIFEEIDDNYSTILVDEAETFMNSARNTELRGIINSGHRRGGYVRRKGRCYSTWAPKAVALNNHLHPSTELRAIIIKLKRKLPDEVVSRLRQPRQADANNPFNVARRKAARWASDNLEALRNAEPVLPDWLANREADNWTPLLAIAEAAGWPKRARNAARAITREKVKERPEEEYLLKDMKGLFDRTGSPLGSEWIVAQLNAMDGPWPWATCKGGGPLTTTYLARMLKKFDIEPVADLRTVMPAGKSRGVKGYRVQQFTDAFKRFVRD